MSRAIPMEILTHSCILRKYGHDGIFGERVLISETAVSQVRLSLFRERRSEAEGIRETRGGTLYYDCKNSIPMNAVFIEDDYTYTIVFDGEEFEIKDVKYFYLFRELHHLEIGLGGMR